MRLTKNSLRQMIMSEVIKQTNQTKINEEVTADLASMDMVLSGIIDEFERAFDLIESDPSGSGIELAWQTLQGLTDVSNSIRNMSEISDAKHDSH